MKRPCCLTLRASLALSQREGTIDSFATTDDGVRLRVRREGRENGPPLLLSNSLGTDLTMWDAQVPTLGAHFSILRYDTRGHGGSDAPADDYAIERLGRDALAVAEAHGWSRFNFCGVSLGAMTGFWLATHARERLNRLVAANGSPYAGGPQGWVDRMAQVASAGLGPIADAVVGRWFTFAFAQAHPDVVRHIVVTLRASSVTGYLGCSAALRDMDLRPGLGGFSTPTLLIGGAHDPAPTAAVIQGLATTIPGAKSVILDAAHLSNVGDPAGFDRAVTEFLA